MASTLVLPDPTALADLRTYLGRADRIDRASVRLVAGEGAIFWVFHVIRDYARTLEARESRFLPELDRLRAVADEAEAAQVPMPIVFGHHDLLPGNFLETEDGRLWLIDFEYAAFGTSMFDLACAAGNAGMGEGETAELLHAYFGEAPSSQDACDYREDCEAYHAGDEDYASQIWYWTTPIAECVDGRTDVECVDYSKWTEAWSEIKG